MEKKQSSLEWYIEETFKLSVKFERQEISQDEYTLGYSNLLQQAKAMHREETEHYGAKCCMMTLQKNQWSLEQLYNETFGGNNE